MRQVTDRSGAKIRVEFVLEGLNLLLRVEFVLEGLNLLLRVKFVLEGLNLLLRVEFVLPVAGCSFFVARCGIHVFCFLARRRVFVFLGKKIFQKQTKKI